MKTYDISTKIKTFRGEEVPVYFPSKEQKEAAIGADKKLDVTKLPRETVQDILLTALESFPANDRKTTFLVHNVGQAIVTNTKPELSKMQVDFLTTVTEWATLHEEEDREGKQELRGIYPAWKTAQVFSALGLSE
jgi:ATP-dependent Clp protease adapter protein ClpS